MDDGLAAVEAAEARVREGERAAARSQALAQQVEAEQAALDDLRQRAAEDEHRADSLTGVTVSHVVAMIRGNLAQQSDRAHADTLASRLELATREAAQARLVADRDAATLRAGQLDDDRRMLDQAMQQRQHLLEQSGDPRAGELLSLSQQLSGRQAEMKETGEAIAAAEAAHEALDAVARELGGAQSWSTYDTFFGGGTLSSMAKHARLEHAASAAGQAQAALRSLAAELQDVGDPASLGLPEISPGLAVMDVWFDNIFSDWMVNSRIHASRDSVAATIDRVARLQTDLDARRSKIAADVAALASKRAALISAR